VRYVVSKNCRKVLLFRDSPGVLMSTAARTPGFEPPAHPFIDGQALDATAESELAAVLSRCSSAPEFIARLTQLGYAVQSEPVS